MTSGTKRQTNDEMLYGYGIRKSFKINFIFDFLFIMFLNQTFPAKLNRH